MRDVMTPARERSESHVAWIMLLGMLGLLVLGGLTAVGATLGSLYAIAAVLAVVAVAVVVTNPVWGVIVFIGTLLLGLPGFLAGDGRLTANNMLGLILLALLVVQICMTRDLWFMRTPQIILFLLIGAVLIASLMHARHIYIPLQPPRLLFSTGAPRDFTENTLFTFFARLAFLLMFVNFVKTRKHVVLILVSLLLFTMAVIPSAVYNAASYDAEEDIATGKTVDPDTGQTTEFRVTSGVSSWGKNENRLAFMCNVSILLIWMFTQIWKGMLVRFVAFGVILMMAALTLATASRSGFLSLGLVLLFLLCQKGISWSLRGVVVGAMIFCALIFFLALPRASYERLLNYSLDQSTRPEAWRSTQTRIELHENSLAVLRSAPLLGVGPGNFRWLHRERFPYSIAAGRPNHNSYFWAATEGGLPALALYLLLLGFIWYELRAAQRMYSRDDVLWHVTRFLRGFLLVFIFFSAFADFWLEPHLYLLGGLSMLLLRRRLDPDPASRPAVAGSPALAAPGIAS